MTTQEMRQACKDMRHILINHLGYKDIIKDSSGYIDVVEKEELEEIYRRLMMIVKTKAIRKMR